MMAHLSQALLILFFLCLSQASNTQQAFSPSDVSRIDTIWQWCSCQTGLTSVTLWPHYQSLRNFSVHVNSVKWIKFEGPVTKIVWRCDNSTKIHSTNVNLSNNQWISVLLFNQTKKTAGHKCKQQTGRLSINIWNITEHISSVPFTSHTEGYACFKIPTLLHTHKNTLIAFAQARTPGCDDFDRTNLVYKRSTDAGKTWQKLKKLIEDDTNAEGQCGHALVIGNISPLQLRRDSKIHPNRILAPYTRNNFKLWITYSDDDGITWHPSRQIPKVSDTAEHPDCNRNMSYFGLNIDQLKLRNIPDFIRFFNLICKMSNPYNNPKWTSKLKEPWEFIGVGPSRGIQLRNGRVLIPGYHSPIRGLSQVPGTIPLSQLYNNFANGFVLISDDDGDTWHKGKPWPIGQGANEHQMVELDDGSILSNSRSMSTGSPQFRVQAQSVTQGDSFFSSSFTSIPQPFAGCQGSTVAGSSGKVYVASPNPTRGKSLLQYYVDALGCNINLNGRQKVSLWISRDNGKSYSLNQVIDDGLSAQTSMEYNKGDIQLLYEQADPLPRNLENSLLQQGVRNLRVLLPTRFVYRQVFIKE